MKKIMIFLMCICLVVSLSGCYWNTSEAETENNDNRIKIVFNDGFVLIYVDNETGCQYFVRSGSGACLMVDENGNPLIYEEVGEDNG